MGPRKSATALAILCGVVYLLGCDLSSPTADNSIDSPARPIRTATTWTVRRPISMPVGGTSDVYFADSATTASAIDVVRMGTVFTESTERTLDLYTSRKPEEQLSSEIIRAVRRGIRVRAILPAEFVASAEGRRWSAAGIECKSDVKMIESDQDFMVADGERLLVGNWDFISGEQSDSSLLFWLDEEGVASTFTTWFASRWQGNKTQQQPLANNYGANVSPARTRASIGSMKQTSRSIDQAIRHARRSVHFLAGDVADQELACALAEVAHRGVEVAGVIDAHEGSGMSELERLVSLEQVHVMVNGTQGSAMRHNFFIIDGNYVVVLSKMPRGSANSLEFASVITTRDTKLLAAFKEEFARIQGRAAATIASRLERAFR